MSIQTFIEAIGDYAEINEAAGPQEQILTGKVIKVAYHVKGIKKSVVFGAKPGEVKKATKGQPDHSVVCAFTLDLGKGQKLWVKTPPLFLAFDKWKTWGLKDKVEWWEDQKTDFAINFGKDIVTVTGVRSKVKKGSTLKVKCVVSSTKGTFSFAKTTKTVVPKVIDWNAKTPAGVKSKKTCGICKANDHDPKFSQCYNCGQVINQTKIDAPSITQIMKAVGSALEGVETQIMRHLFPFKTPKKAGAAAAKIKNADLLKMHRARTAAKMIASPGHPGDFKGKVMGMQKTYKVYKRLLKQMKG